jgi:hypothetical protein
MEERVEKEDRSSQQCRAHQRPPRPRSIPFGIEPHRLDRHRSTHQLLVTADVVIIGGGFAGASIAHRLLPKSASAQTQPLILIL